MVTYFEGEDEGEAESVYVSIPNPLSPVLPILTSIPHALRLSSLTNEMLLVLLGFAQSQRSFPDQAIAKTKVRANNCPHFWRNGASFLELAPWIDPARIYPIKPWPADVSGVPSCSS